MRVYVKQNTDALRALERDLPDTIVARLMGTEVEVNERFETAIKINGTETTWALPPEAVKVLTE